MGVCAPLSELLKQLQVLCMNIMDINQRIWLAAGGATNPAKLGSAFSASPLAKSAVVLRVAATHCAGNLHSAITSVSGNLSVILVQCKRTFSATLLT